MPKITGSTGASNRLHGLGGQRKVALVGRALFAGGEIIKAAAAHSITEGSVSGKGHVPSKPGEPPNADTHQLDRGIIVEQPAPLRVLIASTAPHALPLERGTNKMAARPSMGPAARQSRAEVTTLVGKAVDIAISQKG